jgi:hypothetical protein
METTTSAVAATVAPATVVITKADSDAIIALILAANEPKAPTARMIRRAARIERKSLNAQIIELILAAGFDTMPAMA